VNFIIPVTEKKALTNNLQTEEESEEADIKELEEEAQKRE